MCTRTIGLRHWEGLLRHGGEPEHGAVQRQERTDPIIHYQLPGRKYLADQIIPPTGREPEQSLWIVNDSRAQKAPTCSANVIISNHLPVLRYGRSGSVPLTRATVNYSGKLVSPSKTAAGRSSPIV